MKIGIVVFSVMFVVSAGANETNVPSGDLERGQKVGTLVQSQASSTSWGTLYVLVREGCPYCQKFKENEGNGTGIAKEGLAIEYLDADMDVEQLEKLGVKDPSRVLVPSFYVVARDEVNGKPIHQWRGYTTNDEGVRFWGQIAESKRIHAQIGDEKVRLAFPLEKLGEKGTSAR